MATSFIKLDDEYGFWVDDSLMQVAFYRLFLELKESGEAELLPFGFIERIWDNSQGVFVGFMHFGLNEEPNLDEIKAILINVVKRVIKKLNMRSEPISVAELNSFQTLSSTRREWSEPLDTSVLLYVFEKLYLLLTEPSLLSVSSEAPDPKLVSPDKWS